MATKDIYKTIKAERTDVFDQECNEAAKDGWTPLYPMTATAFYEDNTHFIIYVQQWVKSVE